MTLATVGAIAIAAAEEAAVAVHMSLVGLSKVMVNLTASPKG
jgi:hypothetical protein